MDETAAKLKMTAWNDWAAWEYTSAHKGTSTYTGTNTCTRQIGPRHMRQSDSRPAVLTNCMLKIVTQAAGWKAPRHKIAAWLCIGGSGTQPSLRKLLSFGAVQVPGQSTDQHRSSKPTMFSTWLHVAPSSSSSSSSLITRLFFLHKSTDFARARKGAPFRNLFYLMGEPWPQRWLTYQNQQRSKQWQAATCESCDKKVTGSTPRLRLLNPGHLGLGVFSALIHECYSRVGGFDTLTLNSMKIFY